MSIYLPIIIMCVMWFIMLNNQKRNNEAIITRQVLKKTRKENTEVIEFAKKFIGKECIINALDSSIFVGVIKEVNDGAVLIENDGTIEAINLDFAISIGEYTRNKKGKKKSIALD